MAAPVSADFVVIGSGIAGLRAAIALAPARVVILTKADPGAGSTGYAQGGIAAAVGADDSPARHAAFAARRDRMKSMDALRSPAGSAEAWTDGAKHSNETGPA